MLLLLVLLQALLDPLAYDLGVVLREPLLEAILGGLLHVESGRACDMSIEGGQQPGVGEIYHEV